MQKIKALLIASIVFTGCATQKEIECCGTESHQCDEFYPYTCDDSSFTVYTTRDYKKYVYKQWRQYPNTQPNAVNYYYHNTQTVYYVPTQECVIPPVNNNNVVTNTPRPERLGSWNNTNSGNNRGHNNGSLSRSKRD